MLKKIVFLSLFLYFTVLQPQISIGQTIPTGLFGFWAWGNWDDALNLAKTNNFSIAVGPNTKELLDKANQRGIKCIVNITLTTEIANDEVRWNKYLADLTTLVDTLKSHPALFAWYPVDEPDWQKIPIYKIKQIRSIIKGRDPLHPMFVVLQSPKTWAPYLPYFDIISVDPYLMQQPSGLRDKPDKVKDYLTKVKSDMKKLKINKPLWVVLGAFEQKPVATSNSSYFCSPTPAEFDSMLKYALTEKVDGILVFALSMTGQPTYNNWNLPRDNPALWEVVRTKVPLSQK